MSASCSGIKKDGQPCTYKGKFEKDGCRFCKTHLPLEECSVCYESITERNAVGLTCKHLFHGKCLKKWIRGNHNTCPYCRAPIEDDVLEKLCPLPENEANTFIVDFQGALPANLNQDLQRFIMTLLNVHVLGLVTAGQTLNATFRENAGNEP
jgi:hypothetical protein